MNKYAGIGLGDLSWAGILATGGVGALGGFVLDRYIRKNKDLTSNLLWGAGGLGLGALGSVAWQAGDKYFKDKAAKEAPNKPGAPKGKGATRADKDEALVKQVQATHPELSPEQAKAKAEEIKNYEPTKPANKPYDLSPGWGSAVGTAGGTLWASPHYMDALEAHAKAQEARSERLVTQTQSLDSSVSQGKTPDKNTNPSTYKQIIAVDKSHKAVTIDDKVYITGKDKTLVRDPKTGEVFGVDSKDIGKGQKAVVEYRGSKTRTVVAGPGASTQVTDPGTRVIRIRERSSGKPVKHVKTGKPLEPVKSSTRVEVRRPTRKAGKFTTEIVQPGEIKVAYPAGTTNSIVKPLAKGGFRQAFGMGAGYLFDVIYRNAEQIGDWMLQFGRNNVAPEVESAGESFGRGMRRSLDSASKSAEKFSNM